MNKFPFKIGTTSMVWGADLLNNVRRLASIVDYFEIVLFMTPHQHNLPSESEIAKLKTMASGEGLRFTVHLPASLGPPSADERIRETSLAVGLEICRSLMELDPEHFVLHLPFSPPTLVPVPYLYFHLKNPGGEWNAWTERAAGALRRFQELLESPERLLVENINYAPGFLVPLLRADLCRFCLDIGHLLLGGEPVAEHLEYFRPWIREIHLHGVAGYEEHLSLKHLPRSRLQKWLKILKGQGYRGIVNLELFTPEDFQESLQILNSLASSGQI